MKFQSIGQSVFAFAGSGWYDDSLSGVSMKVIRSRRLVSRDTIKVPADRDESWYCAPTGQTLRD